MAKKYLSLDEAAERIGATTERLLRLREEGEIRGFADRGSWKFREQDVEEFVRSQQADSSPDIPMMTPDDEADDASVLADDDEGKVDLSASDSDVRLFFDETLFDDDEEVDLSDSDSDVQLSGDSGPNLESDVAEAGSVLEYNEDKKQSDSDSDVSLVGGGTEADFDLLSGDTLPSRGVFGEMPGIKTDSDINLTADTGNSDADDDSDSDVLLTDTPSGVGRDQDSDSDVLLTDSDSDVRLSSDSSSNLLGDELPVSTDSDSDVHLMDADSNVLSEDSDSDVKLGVDRTDSDIRLVEAPEDETTGTDPGMQLPEDSDLKLLDSPSEEEDDSGITLESAAMGGGSDESGISLEIDDSGISLEADDSGISLESLDSGTGFADDSGITLDAGDSGISLEAADSGIALFDDDSGLTLDEADMGSTMPMAAVAGAGAALAASQAGQTTHMEIPSDEGEDSDFELAGLDREDDDSGTDTSMLTFDDSGSHEAVAEDEYGTDEDFEDDFEEDLDDVWDAEDEADDDFESGESQVDGFAAPASARMVTDAPWSTGWTAAVSFAALFSALCAFIGIELVRTMWLWTQPGQSESWLLSILGGLF